MVRAIWDVLWRRTVRRAVLQRRASAASRWWLEAALVVATAGVLYYVILTSPAQFPPSLDGEGAFDFVPASYGMLFFYVTAFIAAAVQIVRDGGKGSGEAGEILIPASRTASSEGQRLQLRTSGRRGFCR